MRWARGCGACARSAHTTWRRRWLVPTHRLPHPSPPTPLAELLARSPNKQQQSHAVARACPMLCRRQSEAAGEQTAEGGRANSDDSLTSGSAFAWRVVGDLLCEIKRQMTKRERLQLLRELRR